MAAILAVALLMAGPALAEVRRGDSGEEVYQLQTLLLECGWLFEEPDGQFGARTEDALKRYQRFAGLAEDGVATDEVVERLRADRAELFGQTPEKGGEEPEGGAGGNEEHQDLPERCRVVLEEGGERIEYCAAHRAIFLRGEQMQIGGTTEDIRRAEAMWEDEVDSLYSDWMNRAAPEDKMAVLAAYSGWKASLQAQRDVFEAIYPQDAGMVSWEMMFILKAQAALLCDMNAGTEAGE